MWFRLQERDFLLCLSSMEAPKLHLYHNSDNHLIVSHCRLKQQMPCISVTAPLYFLKTEFNSTCPTSKTHQIHPLHRARPTPNLAEGFVQLHLQLFYLRLKSLTKGTGGNEKHWGDKANHCKYSVINAWIYHTNVDDSNLHDTSSHSQKMKKILTHYRIICPLWLTSKLITSI